jgi:hypothetical protein
MEKKTKLFITFMSLIVLVGSLYYFTDFISKVTGYFTGESETAKLAQCLSEKGAEFYGTELCADCEKQRKLFGQSFKLINEINCGKDKSLCPNIREIPAWYINKDIHYGLKTLNELKELSGCE